MFVVEVGAVLTTIAVISQIITGNALGGGNETLLSRNAAPSCLVNPTKKGPTTCVGTNACIFAIGSIAPFVIVRLKPKAGHLSVLAKYPR